MKADQIIDTIIRYVEQKGIVTDESFLRRAQLLDLFGISKSKVLSDFLIRGVEVTGKNYLKAVIDKSTYDLGGQFSYFKVAPAVMNCYEYVGSEDGCNRFRENLTISQFQNTVNLQVPSITLYYFEQGMVKVNNPIIGTILLNYIPTDPMLEPTWNYEIDEYPVDDALIGIICDDMFKTYQSKTLGAPIDTVTDSKESNKSA